MHVLVAGVGWLGRAVSERLVSEGHRVTGVRRRVRGQADLISAGIDPVVADLTDPRSVEHLPESVDAVVACQAPGAGDPEAYRAAYVEVNRTLLVWSRDRAVVSYVYTGSTGVFGYDDGRNVDEETPVSPATESAEILAEAERLVLDAASTGGPGGRVVRLSGLYGPERYGIVERVRRGALALGPGDGAWMNFCHRDDAVATVLAALERGRSAAVYHASDAEPTPRRDVITWIAGRIGVVPAIAPEVAGSRARGPREANRRVLSERTRAELGITLRFPSFREGLESVTA